MPGYDQHLNFSYSTVATAPSPASSGTSLVVAAGNGALFPAVPFNATVWPASVRPTSTNAEIVRVTAISTDTLTTTRAQEGSSARAIIVTDQIAATETAKTFTDIEAQASLDGWQTANESWTYASATTINVPSDATTKYAVGDRLKLTQSATVKYFVVTAVASTVLTITGGTDYTMTNNAISANFYSHAASPNGWPSWFAYTTAYTGFSADPSGSVFRFAVNGRTCTVTVTASLGSGTSNSAGKSWTLPIGSAGSATNTVMVCVGIKDSGTNQFGKHVWSNGSTVTVYPSDTVTSWTNSGNCDLFTDGLFLTYQI